MMKHIFFGAILMVFLGAGCVGRGTENAAVSGKWFLSFDLPEGWVMTAEYDSPRSAAVIPTQEVSPAMKTVVLQSTDKAIIFSGRLPSAEVPAESYVLENYTAIDVYKLDPRYVMSTAAQDLGNGFSTVDGRYFFTASDGSRYQFVIKTNGQSDDLARQVILSAQLVTNDISTPVNGSVGEIETNE